MSSEATLDKAKLASIIGKLAFIMEEVLGPGDLAALRRLDPNAPWVAVFFRLCEEYLKPSLGGPWCDEKERRWAVILKAMAHTVGLHKPDRPFGAALRQIDYSEMRLTRLLRAHGDGLGAELYSAIRHLASKGVHFNWTDAAWLVLKDGDFPRRQVARQYFRISPVVPQTQGALE